MDFDSIRNVVAVIAGVATILNFLFNVFVQWPKFKTKFVGFKLDFATVVWRVAVIITIIGFIVLVVSIFQNVSANRFPSFALVFGGLTVLTGLQVLEQLTWKDYSHIWFSAVWCFESLLMTIVYVYPLIIK